MNEAEAKNYLSSLSGRSSDIVESTDDNYDYSQNSDIIKYADESILERLENKDISLRFSDIVAAKAEAFKQNRLTDGLGDEGPQLIPSVINIQIINN